MARILLPPRTLGAHSDPLILRAALRHTTGFDKRNDVQYRLGIIHKQQKKYDPSLQVRPTYRSAE